MLIVDNLGSVCRVLRVKEAVETASGMLHGRLMRDSAGWRYEGWLSDSVSPASRLDSKTYWVIHLAYG